MKQSHKLWLRSAIIALSAFIIAIICNFTGVFTYFENKTYDLRMTNAAKYKRACRDIAFICVDQESIDYASEKYGWSWPWPREAYARVIDFLSAGNPKAIAFDILYTEPSVYGEQDDIALRDAEARSGKVIQAFYYSEDDYDKILSPVRGISDNAALIANITSAKDSDDVIRRTRIKTEKDSNQLQELLEYSLPYSDYSLGLAPAVLGGLEAGIDSIPFLKDGTALLRYTKSIDDYFPYSIKDIFESYDAMQNGEEGYFVPSDFEDLYIFCAYYAPGLFDICSTPVSQVYPGVGVHITALDNYLTNSFIKKVPDVFNILWIFLLACLPSLIVAISESKFSKYAAAIISEGSVFSGLICIGLPIILFNNGIWLLLVTPLFAFFLSAAANTLISLATEGKQKRFIRSAFSQCLSKDVVNQIINDASSFTLGGKKFQMSAIFTDIQKFSSFSELLSAAELGCLLNYYLTRMSDIIIDEKGTVDKYEGDAIVALVGAPVAMQDHAVHACRAAVKMKKAEIELNKEIKEYAANPKPSWMEDDLYNAFKTLVANNKTIFTRIGINSGEMIAGYFGSEKKKNYTMMGNNVNLASRLEGVNKQYHTNGILISQATYELLEDEFTVRSLDRVRVVNINTPIQLYEVLDEKRTTSLEMISYITKWEIAMKEFNAKNYSKAKELFAGLLLEKPDDNTAKYYIHLLDDYFLKGTYPKDADNEGVEYNPEDGVFKLLQK